MVGMTICQPTPARRPVFHSVTPGTHFIDDARDFVSWNAWILNSGAGAFFREYVTVANTTGLHPDAHFS